MDGLVEGNDLAINICFTYCSGNQLSILRAEVENQDFFRHGDAKVKKIGQSGWDTPRNLFSVDGVKMGGERF